MQITIKTKNIELTPAIESFINKKIGSLKKFIGSFENHELPITGERGLFDAFVEIGKGSNHHRKGDVFKAEVKIYAPGKNLFAECSGEDLLKCISELRDEMESEIRKYKSKIVEFPRRQAKKENRNMEF
jgi:ribosomal subunit interface protein